MYEKENVLVLEDKLLREFAEKKGYTTDGLLPIEYEEFLQLLSKATFMKRELAEENPEYRQVIPYFVLTNGANFYMMRRLNKAGEQRLHNLIGCFGGHINDGDSETKNPVEAFERGIWREFHEELNATVLVIEFIGLLMLNKTPVDKVHVGAVFHMKVSNPMIKETEKYEELIFPITKWEDYVDEMESWAKEATTFLCVKHVSANGL